MCFKCVYVIYNTLTTEINGLSKVSLWESGATIVDICRDRCQSKAITHEFLKNTNWIIALKERRNEEENCISRTKEKKKTDAKLFWNDEIWLLLVRRNLLLRDFIIVKIVSLSLFHCAAAAVQYNVGLWAEKWYSFIMIEI